MSDYTNERYWAPACGLYCGICLDLRNGECHGCGCDCGDCAGAHHLGRCTIAHCAQERGLESCADCDEMPCTRLIRFTYDPIRRTHAACIESLRRRKRIGTEAWLREQAEYWRDRHASHKWLLLSRACSRDAAALRAAEADQEPKDS